MNLLRSKVSFFFITLILFCLGSPLFAFAESTIQCHCFTARTYNPADRFAADDYLLATSFNSLLARSYNVPKRQIVMIKMNEGASQEELLISLKLSAITREDPRKFLGQRQENNTWPQIISGLTQGERIKNDAILEAIRTGTPAEEAGAKIADEIIGAFFGIAPDEIRKLRAFGLNEKEITLIYILVHAGGQKTEALVEKHERQGMSWGEIANGLGLEPAAAGELILAYPTGQISE